MSQFAKPIDVLAFFVVGGCLAAWAVIEVIFCLMKRSRRERRTFLDSREQYGQKGKEL